MVLAKKPSYAEGSLMAEFPALPLFTDAFIGDTTHLSAAQTGAYLMLLMIAWRTEDCTLPDEDEKLARYARMDLRTWKNNRSTVIEFFQKDSNGRLYQPRLSDERNYVEHMRSKNSRAGQASALKRLNRASTTVPTKAQHLFNPHTHTSSLRSEPPTPKQAKSPTSNPNLPDWVPVSAWQGWLDVRKAKRAPATPEAVRLSLIELEKLRNSGNDPEAVLNQSTQKGWTGLFPLKTNAYRPAKKQRSKFVTDAMDEMDDAKSAEVGGDGVSKVEKSDV